MSTHVTLIDAFTTVAGEGNRAGVVLDADDLSPARMLAIAKAVGASETAFVRAQAGGVALRYFTPANEIDFCGHATLASAHLLRETGRAPVGRLALTCNLGAIDVEVERDRAWIRPPTLAPFTDAPIAASELAALLGGARLDPALPIRRSGPNVYVPVESLAALVALAPRFEALAALAPAHGVFGVYAFTREASTRAHVTQGRFFAPAHGVREDPVTGSASGPLAAYLATYGALPFPPGERRVRARVEQGDAMGKPGRVDLEVTRGDGDRLDVRFGGAAVTVMDAALRV